jgi:hypothetical protein
MLQSSAIAISEKGNQASILIIKPQMKSIFFSYSPVNCKSRGELPILHFSASHVFRLLRSLTSASIFGVAHRTFGFGIWRPCGHENDHGDGYTTTATTALSVARFNLGVLYAMEVLKCVPVQAASCVEALHLSGPESQQCRTDQCSTFYRR